MFPYFGDETFLNTILTLHLLLSFIVLPTIIRPFSDDSPLLCASKAHVKRLEATGREDNTVTPCERDGDGRCFLPYLTNILNFRIIASSPPTDPAGSGWVVGQGMAWLLAPGLWVLLTSPSFFLPSSLSSAVVHSWLVRIHCAPT